MGNLKQIWPCEISTDEKNKVSGLRRLSVRWCDKLINIFPNNPLPMLKNLEELKVFRCGSIEVIFNIDFESVSEMEGYISRLRSIDVCYLENLKELWRMRGVNNSNILINGFQAIQTIYIIDCKRFKNVFTPVTTNFDLSALTSYNTKSYQDNVMSEADDYIPDVTYPSYLLHTCPHLQHLHLMLDKRVGEAMFDMDSPTSSRRQLATIQPPLLLPYLQTIKLWWLIEMSHVWKCNWNTFLIRHHPPLQFPFQNLTDIDLRSCHKIKYLFSPLMAKYLSNLKSVYIRSCDGMEEVISRRDDENTTSASYQDTTFFPHLDTLKLGFLKRLKTVDDGGMTCGRDKLFSNNMIHDEFQSGQVNGACWSLCQYPTKISIEDCDALSSLIPWYAVGQMKRLQELDISYCKRMMELFESESGSNNVDEGGARVVGGPPLKNVTIVGVPQLSNLTKVKIVRCDLLSYIFTFSTLESLKQLQELHVSYCKAMQVIVKEEKETSSKCVVFPRLETLELEGLPKLKGFFLGMNDFRWPSLDHVLINECPELMMFTSGQSKTPKLRYIETSFGKYSPECGLNFHETISQTTFPTSSEPTISKGMPFSFNSLMIEINLKEKNVGTTIVPSNALLQWEKLQQITIVRCDGLEEVFEVGALEGSGSSESKTLVPIPNLTQVKLEEAKDLKYLWKSNQWMVLEFPNLTKVDISKCHKLEHVFTCSMVGSLVQLQDLIISDCGKIEVIVKGEEEEECDAKVNEIILPRLNSLKLQRLSNLKGFCLGNEAFSLPALDTLQIEDCPAITCFTDGQVATPELKVIDTWFGFCYVKTDINSLLKTNKRRGVNSRT